MRTRSLLAVAMALLALVPTGVHSATGTAAPAARQAVEVPLAVFAPQAGDDRRNGAFGAETYRNVAH